MENTQVEDLTELSSEEQKNVPKDNKFIDVESSTGDVTEDEEDGFIDDDEEDEDDYDEDDDSSILELPKKRLTKIETPISVEKPIPEVSKKKDEQPKKVSNGKITPKQIEPSKSKEKTVHTNPNPKPIQSSNSTPKPTSKPKPKVNQNIAIVPTNPPLPKKSNKSLIEKKRKREEDEEKEEKKKLTKCAEVREFILKNPYFPITQKDVFNSTKSEGIQKLLSKNRHLCALLYQSIKTTCHSTNGFHTWLANYEKEHKVRIPEGELEINITSDSDEE